MTRQERINLGICIDCDEFATPNRNYRQGLRCEKHKGTSGVNQDGADDPVAVQDTARFKEVLLTVINFIADKDIGGGKGVTYGQVIRETGADSGLIDIALRWLQIAHKSHPTLHITRTIPERYTFRDTRVKVIPHSEYPKNWQPPKSSTWMFLGTEKVYKQ